MSRDISSNRSVQFLANENEFESPLNQIPLALSRAPLNSIPDPSQYQSKTPENDTKEKPQSSTRLASSFHKTPGSRIHNRGKSGYLEAFSAQTSIRNGTRLSNVGTGFNSTSPVRLPLGGRFGVLPRVSRGVSVAVPQKLLVDVPCFDLDEDPSFWKDHNVQVLIRIRPMNDDEKVSQGYGRCLRQETAHTLVWLGNPETRFTFDHIACESTSQEKLFRVAGLPTVDNCMSGYNSCMFAYGQTGSGKTYTMMGEVDKVDGGVSDDCGITPRIFEYLFTRIREEEESRKNDRLTYSCKCSFLEIYNEHITDLLEPLSTNLQLREDLKKGVYVENLSEHSVRTVDDVLKLLQQGTANRKIAATYMNCESSRSHSVFTCIIESRWDKDSMAHLRFGRLNLVDLAGSERQKSSWAEGDRLKEAANINKSLSTLGLVIMSLVDLAQGKHRHVPYRDSRLTFLLQDSLGGNSKTTIIANVSPSARSVNETLGTLKFAQRAKLIQNNAKINEDASGDVIFLQQKIQQLEGQLSFFMKHQPPSTEQLDFAPSPNQLRSLDNHPQRRQSYDEVSMDDEQSAPTKENMKINDFKATLCGALRREKLAEIEVRRLNADIEQLNSLLYQQEEEAKHTKMVLRFNEEKIKRLELLSDGLLSADKFYQDENNALRDEILRLQEKITRNPEIIRLASENQTLRQQIRLYQDSREEGDRQAMLAEISQLRNQLLELVGLEEFNAHPQLSHLKWKQEFEVAKELEYCKDMNSNLIREVDELRQEMGNALNFDQDTSISVAEALVKCEDDITDEPNPMNFNLGKREDMLDFDNHQQLIDAESLITTMKLEHFQLIKDLEATQVENQCLVKMLNSEENVQLKIEDKHDDHLHKQIGCINQDPTEKIEVTETASIMTLQAKLDKLSCDLKEAEILNRQYTEDQSRLISQDHQIESIRDEVELETTETIIHLQEEIDRLESEFQVRLSSLDEQNASLRKNLALKEDELRMFCAEWEQAILELTTFLIDGSRSLGDASGQIKSICSSFDGVNDWVSEHVEKAAKICIEKDETILLLQRSLEDAQNIVMAMEHKIYSLKDATIALTGFPQLSNITFAENDLRANLHSLQASNNIISSCNPVQQENELQFSPQTKFELVQLCKRLSSMNACFDNARNTKCHPDSATKDGSASDYSSSCFSSSAQSVGYAGECSSESRGTSNNLKHQGSIRDYQSTVQSVEACSRNLEELSVKEKQCFPVDFFTKFEETLTTIKEADQTLNSMLKANESASMSTAMWKQEGEKLMEIKVSLSEEIKQLKSSVLLRNAEEECQDQMQFTSTQIANILSLLEKCSLQMRTDVVNFLETAHMDAIEESQATFSGLWSSLEDLTLKEVQNGICIFVLQCQMREYFYELGMLDTMMNSEESAFQEPFLNVDGPGLNHECRNDNAAIQDVDFESERDHMYMLRMKTKELDLADAETVDNNSELKKQLQRKNTLLKGLLFDFSLLQELASHRKDVKDELEKLILALNKVQKELQVKSVQLDDMLFQNSKLERQLVQAEQALFNSNAELDQAKEKLSIYSEQKVELTDLVNDLFLKNSNAEQLLEEQKEITRSLEKEIIRISSSPEEQVTSSMEDIEGAFALATAERDELVQKLASLQDRLDMACALADENQSKAAEARHESEASKLFAEQKEEEVKILENSIEELECTINVMERKVDEMEHEVEKHRLMRESLEFELQELRNRLFIVEDFTDSMTAGNSTPGLPEDQLLRKLRSKCSEVNEAYGRIQSLEEENAKQSKEIKLFKDYISELVLHAEAQASQYQQQYKNLEAMLHEVKTDLSNVAGSSTERDEKTSTRPRGSNSPFKCISGLVQQRNQEKDHELSIAKVRMQELESLASSRHKQVCILQSRLASTESMTHDVIRDLLSVKLDILNCADMIDQQQIQKLIEDAQHQRQEFAAMEQEIGNLRSHIEDLMEERDRYFSEINESKEQQLACEIMLEQLQERDQLLVAQNDMLKTDKSKLQKRVVELDDMMRKLFKMQETQSHNQPETSSSSLRTSQSNIGERMVSSQKMLPRINNNFVQYHNPNGDKSVTDHETKFRKQRMQMP